MSIKCEKSLRKVHVKLCELLDSSVFLPFCNSLLEKQIIDRKVKNSVKLKGGYAGADDLVSHIELMVEQQPDRRFDKVLDALEEQPLLREVARELRGMTDRPKKPGSRSATTSDRSSLESYSSEEESESMPRRKKSKRTADSDDEQTHVSERERKRKRGHPKRKSKQPPVPTESESEDESVDEPDYGGSLKRKCSVNNKKSKQIPTSESQADSSEEEYESAEERQHKTGTKNKKQSKRMEHCKRKKKHQTSTPKSQSKVSKQESSDNPSKGFLSGKDIPEVVKSLGSFTRYFQLGIHLKIDFDELKQIEANFPRDNKRCQEEMIGLWINSGEATWGKLVGALRTVGNIRLANEIEAKHISN